MDMTVLEKSSLFQGIRPEEIEKCIDAVSCRAEHYEKDDFILHSMNKADTVGIILSGRAEVQKIFGAGNQINVTVRTAGSLIGSAAVFSRAGKYPCDVVALEKTSVLLFRKQDILSLMRRNSRIMENFLMQLGSAAYMLQEKLELMSYSGISQKIAFYLLMYRRQTGKECFPIPGSVTKWAMLMHVSRPSLHRELKKLENDKMIRYEPPEIEILDVQGLEQLLS